MSAADSVDKSENKHRVEPKFDDALQRELDEALGGMSLEDIVASDEAMAKGAAPARARA